TGSSQNVTAADDTAAFFEMYRVGGS
ncbi:hypothetical protein LCGC14_3103170, partial [marine sediment metagenome]